LYVALSLLNEEQGHMPTSQGAKPPSGKKPAQPAKKKQQQPEVKPLSPLALAGAIVAAVLIAAVLLFVINNRVAANPAPSGVVVPTAIAAGVPGPTQATSSGTTQVSGFAKGNAQAKVTVTEYSDFK
jgi:hypothetical protein